MLGYHEDVDSNVRDDKQTLGFSNRKEARGLDGYPAHSHHDKFPPWWVFVRDDDGGNLSVTKSHH